MSSDVLLDELKGLRRGRCGRRSDISERVGDRLREVCGIDRSDPPGVVREKLASRLGDLAGTLPDELRVATAVALAIHPNARHLLLQDRLRWLAEQLAGTGVPLDGGWTRASPGWPRSPPGATGRPGCCPTVRVRAGTSPGCTPSSGRTCPDRWRTSAVPSSPSGTACGRSGSGSPCRASTATSARRTCWWTSTSAAPWCAGSGSRDCRFQCILALPAPLRAGEAHEYGVTMSLPPQQPIRPHYVVTPALSLRRVRAAGALRPVRAAGRRAAGRGRLPPRVGRPDRALARCWRRTARVRSGRGSPTSSSASATACAGARPGAPVHPGRPGRAGRPGAVVGLLSRRG